MDISYKKSKLYGQIFLIGYIWESQNAYENKFFDKSFQQE